MAPLEDAGVPAPTGPPPAPVPVRETEGAAERFDSPQGEWSWEPPDLAYNRAFYRKSLRSLKLAVKTYPAARHADLLAAGKDDLRRHRQNYGPAGPQHLQILWWEFPQEHWDILRDGCSMNFLAEPASQLSPNSEMTPAQLETATEFFDELVSLGVLEACPSDDPLVATCPLFVVPKPGQPGQWRVIADAKAGGQNTCIGPDPVFLPRVDHILPRMYSGGWSATVDASKFFYQFPTLVSERRYLGALHPTTGQHFRYRGLPMGTANSPSIAGRLGAAFLRKLSDRHPDLFQGEPRENTWRSQVADHSYDSRLGHGRVLMNSDGLPSALRVAFCDDFLLHGPTYEKTALALTKFMDLAVEVGMLCNPVKVEPPSQCVKYCGFLFDTRGVPTLRMPAEKRSRALAMVEYVQSFRGAAFPRLSLVVVTGVLESLVDATPSRLGHTYLRRLYDTVWSTEPAPDATPKDRYYCMVHLGDRGWMDLEWWRIALRSCIARPVRPSRTATLVATFGDGSGTGTGGTSELIGACSPAPMAPMEMWMGTWSTKVHSFSSNWRELKTLVLTLEREVALGAGRAHDTTVFYFTDNLVTYYIVSSGSAHSEPLQALIYRIKALELQLGCFLEAVHIPGTKIIQQGSDDLSRGVWMSRHRDYVPAPRLIPAFFSAVSLRAGWEAQLRRMLPAISLPPALDVIRWDDSWAAADVFDRCTVWIPPPEIALQALSHLITLWTERPLTTSAVVLLPRILQRQWQSLSRHFVRQSSKAYHQGSPITVRKIPSDSFDLSQSGGAIYHCLPVYVLHLAAHVRSLPDPRLESSPFTVPWRRRQWFLQQKQKLYGL